MAKRANDYASGICRTCRAAGECTFPKPFLRSIIQCAAYEPPLPEAAFEPARSGAAGQRRKSQAGPATSDAAGPADRIPGLCRTCAIRLECKYPRPESGVWHCEEYR